MTYDGDEGSEMEKALGEAWRETRFHAMLHIVTMDMKEKDYDTKNDGAVIERAHAIVNTLEKFS